MALGIIAFYLGLAIGISTLVRPVIGYKWWRRLHIFTLLIFGLVTIHGIATGSDTRTWWGIAIYLVSVVLVVSLLVRRLLVPATARGRSHPVLATGLVLALIFGVFWMILGPLQAGWSAIAGGSAAAAVATPSISQANRNTQSGQSIQPAQSSQSGDPFATSFTADLQGQMTQNNNNSNGAETMRLDTTLSNGSQGSLVIVLQGQPGAGGDGSLNVTSTQVTLGPSATSPLYQGYLTNIVGERRWSMTALLTKSGSGKQTSGQQIQLQIEMRIDASGQVSGLVQGAPVSTSNPNASGSPSSNQTV